MTSKLSRNLSFSSRCHWKHEVRRGDDQRPLDQAADLQLLEQQPRHDRLAGAGVVGQEEANARQLEEVVVDRLELVRQRIDAGDGEREVGVVLVGEPQPWASMPRRKRAGSPSNGSRSGVASRNCELVKAQDALVDLPGLLARAYDFDHVTERHDDEHLDRLREHRPANNNAWL